MVLHPYCRGHCSLRIRVVALFGRERRSYAALGSASLVCMSYTDWSLLLSEKL